MKLSVEPKSLADTVAWAARVLPNRPAIPQLASLLLEADNDTLTISATDGDISVQATIACDHVAEPGRILLPGKVLAEAVKLLPAKSFVEVAASERDTLFRSGRTEFSLPILKVDDYPTLPAQASPIGCINADTLQEAVGQVVPATAHHNSNPAYIAIRLDFDGDTLTCVGTDSYRIASRATTWTPAQPRQAAAHMQARPFLDLVRGFTGSEVTIGLDDNLLSLAGDGRSATMRLLAVEEYVNYQERMTLDYPFRAELENADLLEATKRVALFTNADEAIYLTFTTDSVHIRGGDGQIGKGSDIIDCVFDGDEPLTLKFQPHYLTDALSVVHGEKLRIGLRAAHRPCLLTTEDEHYRYLCMPLRVDS
jgi:DNA polymerase-3 subunit beta